tara:strand:- start:302 stop:1210 length:909 start_codon:yes stop_codon:yes gene_type:complete
MGAIIGDITGTTKAAKRAERAQKEAADMAQYQPWNVSGSYFGDANFDYQNNTASYKLSPALTELRDMFMGESFNLAEDASGAAYDASGMRDYGRSLFNQAAASDPRVAGNQYYKDVLSILEPARIGEQQQLAQNLFSSGRTGSAMAAPEGGGYVNPERMEYLTALNRQNEQIAYDSLGRARYEQQEDMDRGIGLYGLADTIRMSPYTNANTLFGMGSGVEMMGQQPMNQGIALGSAAQPGDQARSQGYSNAANTRMNASLANSGMFMNLLGQGAGAYMNRGATPTAGGYTPGGFDRFGSPIR